MAQTPALSSIDRQHASASRQAHAVASGQSSIETQKRSVERQARRAIPVMNPAPAPFAPSDNFYVAPWPEPPRAVGIGMNCSSLSPPERSSLLAAGARHAALPQHLLRAVMEKESAFKPCAVSPVGAIGLMQLMPATADGLGVTDPFDPLQNVLAGSRFLRSLLDRYGGDLSLALGAYNAGPGRVDRLGRVPEIPETQRYVSDILSRLAGDATSLGSSGWP